MGSYLHCTVNVTVRRTAVAFSRALKLSQAIVASVKDAIFLGPGHLMVVLYMNQSWNDEKKKQG